MDYQHLIVDVNDRIGLIKINRPEVRNALNAEAWAELDAAFAALDKDERVAVIMVTGNGDKAFVGGADLNALKARSAVETVDNFNSATLNRIERMSKPTIAVINGFALGGGLELAMACDIRIASEKAKLGQTEINVGIMPGAGGTQRLSRLVGLGKAKEMIFAGTIISAAEAKEIGLVNHVIAHEELMDFALKMAAGIAEKSPLVLKVAKMVIDYGAQADISTGVALEKLAQSFIFSTEDHLEGITAFLEKRAPKFKGR